MSVPLTPEYVVEYFKKNDDIIESLKTRIVALETHKLLLTERNEHLVFRLAAAEQRVNDLNNTIMNHFAYNKPIIKDSSFVAPAPAPAQPAPAPVQPAQASPFQSFQPQPQPQAPLPFQFKFSADPPKTSF